MQGLKGCLLVALTVLYGATIYGRLWANQLTHPGIDTDPEEFRQLVLHYTIRDCAVITAVYAVICLIVIWRGRKK